MTPAASTLAIAMLGSFVVCLQTGSRVWQNWDKSWENTDWESQREQHHISSLQLGQAMLFGFAIYVIPEIFMCLGQARVDWASQNHNQLIMLWYSLKHTCVYLAGQTRVDPTKVGGEPQAQPLEGNVGLHTSSTRHRIWKRPHSCAGHVAGPQNRV